MSTAALYAPRRKRFTVLERFRWGSRVFEVGDLLDPLQLRMDDWFVDQLWRKSRIEVLAEPDPADFQEEPEQVARYHELIEEGWSDAEARAMAFETEEAATEEEE